MIDRPTFVYLIGTGLPGHPFKIGVSTNPIKRCNALQTGHGEPLRLIMLVLGDSKLEAWLHRRFVNHATGGGKEWFTITTAQFIEAVERYKLDQTCQTILPFMPRPKRNRLGNYFYG